MDEEKLLDVALELIASNDPLKQIKGRMIRDVMVPTSNWAEGELDRFMDASTKNIAMRDNLVVAAWQADFMSALSQGLGLTLAKVMAPHLAAVVASSHEPIIKILFATMERSFRESHVVRGAGR